MLARSCEDAAEWDELVARVPWTTVHHAFGYGRLLAECFGYLRPAYRLIDSGGRPIAGLPLVLFAAGGPLRSLQALPFDIYGGVLLDPEHEDDPDLAAAVSAEIDAAARRAGAFEARFSIPVTAPAAVRRCLEAHGRVRTVPHDCPVLGIARPLEDVRRGYAPALKRALRRSVREGVTVAVEPDLAGVCEAYPHYVARMREIGAAVKPWRFVEGLLRRELGVPFVARRDGRVAGFLVLLATPGVAIYWISAQHPEAAPARPMGAMLDAAVAWAHARGIPLFSLGESHGRPGLIRFKQGFGPERAESVVVVRTYRPALQRGWHAVQPVAKRAYGAWERLRGDGRGESVPAEGRPRSARARQPIAATAGEATGKPSGRATGKPIGPPLLVPELSDLAEALPGARVLVTGATGFIGQHVARTLLGVPGLRVRGLVRSRERVVEVFGHDPPGLELVVGDLTAPESLRGLCADVDVVVHAGSAVAYALSASDPSIIFERVNVEGTASLALEAARAGVRRFVLVSSTGAMGTPSERIVDETTPCRPTTAYARSKLAAEERLLQVRRETGLEVVMVRPCLVAGEGKRGGELLKLFRLCRRGVFPVVGGGLEVEKPLVDVGDVVQALLRAVLRGRPGDAYLVHSGGGHTLGEILRAAGELVGKPRPWLTIPLPVARASAHVTTPVFRLLGRRPPLTPERLDLFLADRSIVIRKAREELGYEPRHRDVRAMLARTHDWYVRTGQL